MFTYCFKLFSRKMWKQDGNYRAVLHRNHDRDLF